MSKVLSITKGSSGGGAPTGASYVTLGLDGTLTAERVLTGTANQVILTDAGANGNITLSTPQDIGTGSSVTFGNITDSAMTAGSVLFAGTAGIVSQNNTQFYWDNGSKTLVFPGGTTAVGVSTELIRGVGEGSDMQSSFEIYNGIKASAAPIFAFKRGRGTFASPAIAQNNDSIGSFNFYVVTNGTGPVLTPSAGFGALADGTISATNAAGRFFISTCAAGTLNLTEALRIDSNQNVGIGVTGPTAKLHLVAGTATASTSPLKFNAGTNLTTAEAGAVEYDGVQLYNTIDTTSGRGAVPIEQYFHLTAAGGTIGTIANYFGTTSNISLVASGYYEIDIYLYYLKTTAGTVTWTLTNSAAPTSQNIFYEMSPVGGITAPPGDANMLQGQIYNDATAAKTIVTASLTTAVNHYAHFKIFLQNGTGTSLKIQATCSAGTITPGINSWWFARRLSPNNIGTFAA